MPAFTIELTTHAIERYQQRVRPALDVEDAADELGHVALFGTVSEEPPEWHAHTCAQLSPFYLEVADIVLPLKPHRTQPGVLVATTCLAKSDLSPDARRHRNARRRRRAVTSGRSRTTPY